MWMIHGFSFPPYRHHCLQGNTFNLAMASGRMMFWRPLDINVDSHNTASFRWRSPFNRSEALRNFPSKIFRSISSEKEYFRILQFLGGGSVARKDNPPQFVG